MEFQNNNQEVTKELQKNTGLSELTGYPRKVAAAIVPTLQVNPKRYVNVIKTANATGTVYTTPTDRDFYLTGCHIGSSTATDAEDTIEITPRGDNTVVVINSMHLYVDVLITTANGISNMDFSVPILLERGSPITATITSDESCWIVIYGYTEDVVGE